MKYLSNVATLELIAGKCTGCGVCTEVCPHAVLAIENKKAVIMDKDSCMECGACANNCAFGALRVDKGVGCAAAVINGMIKVRGPSCDCGGGSGKGECCG